jgi:protein-tyrosine phosphatase
LNLPASLSDNPRRNMIRLMFFLAAMVLTAPLLLAAGPLPSVGQYIIQPSTDAQATMISPGEAIIRWSVNARKVAVYAGDSPDRTQQLLIERDVDTLPVSGEIHLGNVPPFPRPFFRMVFTDSDMQAREVFAAERRLALEGAVNFRDLGGYKTESGRHTRWGKLFRSDSLAYLSPADQELLCAIGIRNVIDLQTEKEAAQAPDRLPACMTHEYLPVYPEREKPGGIAWLFSRARFEKGWRQFYTELMIDRKAVVFGRFLKRLADADCPPTVFHCRAGKDRTGIAAMLLLAALGVPEQTIIADYSLTNFGFETFHQRVRLKYRWIEAIGISLDRFTPILTADPEYLKNAFDHIRKKYGSVDLYLDKAAGVDRETIRRLRQFFLE